MADIIDRARHTDLIAKQVGVFAAFRELDEWTERVGKRGMDWTGAGAYRRAARVCTRRRHDEGEGALRLGSGHRARLPRRRSGLKDAARAAE